MLHCCCFLVQGLEIILRTLFRGRECVQYTEEREVFGDEEVFTIFHEQKMHMNIIILSQCWLLG